MSGIFKILVSVFLLAIISCQNSHKKDHHARHPHPDGIRMQHDFSDAESWSKRFDSKDRDSWQKPEELVKVMSIKPGETVVDIGAGTGYLVPHLSKAVGTQGKVFALDVEKNLVAFMADRFKREKIKNALAELIPYTSSGERIREANKVVILNTWHHISSRNMYAKDLYSKLGKTSEVFIVEPLRGAGGPGPGDGHRSTAQETIPELEGAGFTCQTIDESLEFQFILRCKK